MTIEFEHLSCRVGDVRVLDDVSFGVARGEVVALLGRSGAGKSTLLNIGAGILDVGEVSGRAVVAGVDMVAADSGQRAAARRGSIGFVFQFAELVAELSLIENVALPLRLCGWTRAAALEQAQELCVGLELDRATSERRPGEVSGGQAQRAAVARALTGSPQVLLCDEPTGALDSESGHETMELISSATQRLQLATLVVTHSSEVSAWARRVLTLRDGRVVGAAGEVGGVDRGGSP